MTGLDDETVIVTGASRGLGAAMTERFAAEGANTVLTARSVDELHDVAAPCDGETLVVPADVTDEAPSLRSSRRRSPSTARSRAW